MPPLTLTLLSWRALSTFRSDFWTVVGLAIAVFVPLGLARAWIESSLHGYWEQGDGALRLTVLVVALTVTTASLFGQTFYAGLLDHVVGARHFGHDERSLGALVRALPFGKLIVVNVIVAVAVVLGYLVFVVPGLIALTLLSIVGPLINIERHSVRDALRHSVRLVRPRFWLAFTAVTIPLTIEHAVVHALSQTIFDGRLVKAIVTSVLVATIFGALVGLLEVTLAHELVARDRSSRERPPPPRLHADSPG